MSNLNSEAINSPRSEALPEYQQSEDDIVFLAKRAADAEYGQSETGTAIAEAKKKIGYTTTPDEEVFEALAEMKLIDAGKLRTHAAFIANGVMKIQGGRRMIGISGKINAGKDTVATIINDILVREDKATLNGRKFAEKLKQMCAILIGCRREDLEDRTFKSTPLPGLNNMTPREIMIKIGDGLRGLLYERVWIDSTFDDEEQNTAVTDVRYPNEGAVIRQKGGILIRVESDRAEILDTPTETALDGRYDLFSYVLYNNGTIHDLYVMIETILKEEGYI